MPVILPTLIILIAALGSYGLSVLFVRTLFRPYSPKQIIGFKVQGILPALLPALAKYVSFMPSGDFLSPEQIEAKLDDPLLMQQLQPEIENHVDDFLKTKLKEAFPLLSNFMGEKTLAKFKQAFLTEVETILPALLKSNAESLINSLQPATIVSDKINSIDLAKLEKLVKQHTTKQLNTFYIIAALLGALMGLLQVLVLYIF